MIDTIEPGSILITAPPAASTAEMNLAWIVVGACLGLLSVAGIWLIHETGWSSSTSATLLLCQALAVIVFFAAGFAIALGGASGLYGGLGPLGGLGREWMPRGEGWGLAGLRGFFLSGAAYSASVYGLFLLHVVFLLLATTITLIPWIERTGRSVAVLYTLAFAGLLYPLYANWAWGGGWLARLGQTEGLGHGLVDVAGSGVVNAAAGLTALGALAALRSSTPTEAVLAKMESRTLAGLFLVTIGWTALVAGSIFALTNERLSIAATNTIVALAFAAATGLLFSWLVRGEPHLLVGVQSALAGLVAIAAGAPFYPAWTAAVVGGVAGLLVPLGAPLFTRITHSALGGAVVAIHSLGGIWGLIAVGLMADGSYGVGWNGIGEGQYLGIPGQGVTGLFPSGMAAADPSQLTAQLIAIGSLAFFPVASFLIVAVLSTLSTRRPTTDRTPAPAMPTTEETTGLTSE